MKRLVVYFDGTWSSPSARTNVFRLSEITAQGLCPDGVFQDSHYWNGVGVRALEWLRGGILGFGTGRNIREAYSWLQERYDDGDQIFVLGFSRGAFSARSLAGMIARCGLLRSDATTSVDVVYQRYADKNEALLPDSRRVPIHFVGVWDTVGALGVPWGNLPGLSRSTTQFHDTEPSSSYRNMFHALAIDEHRAAFAPTFWTTKPDGTGFSLRPDQRLEQTWFVGSHTDVGGGGGRDNPLARITLAWMHDRATECGLVFTQSIASHDDDFEGEVHDSFSDFLGGLYRLVKRNRPFFRPVLSELVETPLGPQRPLEESVHPSARMRQRTDPRYRRSAPNLPLEVDA